VKRAPRKRRRVNGAPQSAGRYVLRLYVTGMTERSARAIASIRALCEEHLKGRYRLQVVDLYTRPQLTRREQIIAAPTLIKKLPLPLRRMVGDLSDRERVLFGLDLREARR
jgi:circadian clock protein KaiB